MSFTDYFERAYVVNLARRTDRRRAMERELSAAGMPAQPGKVEFFRAIQPAEPAGFDNLGCRGCYLSHLEILKQARRDRLANVLIMEDDLAISSRFSANQKPLIEQLQSKQWDFAYFGHFEPVEPQPSAVTLIPWSKDILTTHFYAVNGRCIDRLIEFLESSLVRPAGHPDGGPMPVDGAFSTFRARNADVATLISAPSLGTQRSSYSDIAPRRWFDRMPVVRRLTGAARATKVWVQFQVKTLGGSKSSTSNVTVPN